MMQLNLLFLTTKYQLPFTEALNSVGEKEIFKY